MINDKRMKDIESDLLFWGCTWDIPKKIVKEFITEIKKMKALTSFANHRRECKVYTSTSASINLDPCNCGFSFAWKAWEESKS